MKKGLNREDIKAFFKGFAKIFVLTYLFYKYIPISVISAVIFGIINIKLDAKRRIREWRWQLNLEFREVMTGISSALNAGYSIENAFRESKKDILILYGDKSVMVKELDIMNSKLELNQPIENVLSEFAQYCEVEDIYNFAEVFQTAKRTGGNLIKTARSTADRIGNKIEVVREIKTMISGKQMEGKLMNIIPLGIIVYFWISSPDFLTCMYTSRGRPVMTVLLIVYIAAYKWSERIGDISV